MHVFKHFPFVMQMHYAKHTLNGSKVLMVLSCCMYWGGVWFKASLTRLRRTHDYKTGPHQLGSHVCDSALSFVAQPQARKLCPEAAGCSPKNLQHICQRCLSSCPLLLQLWPGVCPQPRNTSSPRRQSAADVIALSADP